MFSIKLNRECPLLQNSEDEVLSILVNSLISAPATKALSPEPVIITPYLFFVFEFIYSKHVLNSCIVS